MPAGARFERKGSCSCGAITRWASEAEDTLRFSLFVLGTEIPQGIPDLNDFTIVICKRIEDERLEVEDASATTNTMKKTTDADPDSSTEDPNP